MQFYHFARHFAWRKYFPVIFFFGGFAFDALTLGKQVQQSDFVMLTGYLLLAAGILWWLAHHAQRATVNISEAGDRKSTRLNSSHRNTSRMPSSA